VAFCNTLVVLNDSAIQPVDAGSCDTVYVRNSIYYEIVTRKPLIVQNEQRDTTIKDGGESRTGTLELNNGQIQTLTIGHRVFGLLDYAGYCGNKEDALLFQWGRIDQQYRGHKGF
jgi:hypothetical protein